MSSQRAGARLLGRLADGERLEQTLAEKTTLGRHPSNSLRLYDREVSKEHALIERRGGVYVLRDLGSSNGTFVNGRRVTEVTLRHGDQISLGRARLVFDGGEGQARGGRPGITVFASTQHIPAVLAELDAVEDREFLPAEQVSDIRALRTDYEKLRIAHQFHRQVGLDRDYDNLPGRILNAAFEMLTAEHGVLFLTDEKTGDLVPAAVRRRTATVQQEEVLVSETMLRRVLDTRQAVLTADASLDARFSASESIVAQGIRSAMAVPLMAKGSVKGVLFLDTRERTNAFSEKDLEIFSAIAAQAAIALENAELADKIERETLARAELSRFLSPAVADMVVRGEVELLRQGQLSEVTVLFADIRGFTRLAESEPPHKTVAMLNQFFTAMAGCVFRHEGNLDKFIGDCVMAVWGPPSSHPDDSARALRAALDMQHEVEQLNRKRQEEGEPPIEIGIGVNTGQAVVGYMGSNERHDFTAIGDSVNTASRLCGLAPSGEVLASESTIEHAGPGFRVQRLPVKQVKGKEKAIAVYRVLGTDGGGARAAK